ncbi:unnamed protein product [Fraxinus pennsylvanica]|uniref:Uncharacterized protein n=1 Tax=Fraxinus pennsylvanica TaxID=56036 RepID=A0AAD1ZL00_9LAMI|nr:unnamed protein product [Fraxinus pennsylvanica]
MELFYTRLCELARASASSTPLLIFSVTSDVDSLCSLKIIGHVLETDSVRYACYPVSSFKEIHKYEGPSLSSSSNELITLLLINWGYHKDLRRDLEIGPSARVCVVDGHRPIHLHNLSSQNDRVVLHYAKEEKHQADLVYDFEVSALANECDLNGEMSHFGDGGHGVLGKISVESLVQHVFTDQILPELGNLMNLEVLWLKQTNLVGGIPESLGQLWRLTDLDVALNALTGGIPSSLTELKSEVQIELYNNSLIGELPSTG